MAPSVGTTKRPETRSSSQGGTNPTVGKTCEELLKAMISTVHDVKTAKEYLEQKCCVIWGEEYNLANLSMVLLHLSQTSALSKVVVDRLRAAAIILKRLDTNNTAARVAKAITSLISPITKKLATTLVDFQHTSDDLHSAAVSITRTADEFNKNAASMIQCMTDAAADMVISVEEVETVIKTQTQPPTSVPIIQQHPLSYAAAVAMGAPLPPTTCCYNCMGRHMNPPSPSKQGTRGYPQRPRGLDRKRARGEGQSCDGTLKTDGRQHKNNNTVCRGKETPQWWGDL